MTRTEISAEQGIQAAAERFTSAFARQDAQGLVSVYTDAAELLPPNSPEIHGQANIQNFWQAVFDAGITGATVTTREVISMGDDAYEVGQYTLSNGQGEQLDHGKYIQTWRRENGTWRLHRDIWNSSQPQG